MTEFWLRCEGQIVDSYRLGSLLSGAAEDASYSTENGLDSRPTAIKLIRVDGSDRQRQLARWAALAQLSHPSLIGLFGSGYCEIEGVPLLYVIMERSDGDLAGVLPERPLTEVEAREMLGSVLAALTYLHEHGFVHGGVKPSNIVAVADEVKLASDCIACAGKIGTTLPTDVYVAPESWDGGASPAGDVWSLGLTIVEALTQRPPDLAEPAPGNSSDYVIPNSLPEPFFDIASHCLRRNPQARWTVAQIASRFRGPNLTAIPIKTPRKNARPWVTLLAIGGAMLLAITSWLLFSREQSQPGISVAVPASASQRVEAAPPAALNEQPPHSPVKKAGNWFVVVATYAQRKDAEKRALVMTSQFPQFKAEAYAPPLQNQKAYYVVVIGSSLSQESAAALQERARADGLAPDAYITRFQ